MFINFKHFLNAQDMTFPTIAIMTEIMFVLRSQLQTLDNILALYIYY